MKANKHYIAVTEFYGFSRTDRSDVLLISHIDEGLVVLDMLDGVSLHAKEAYCLHPIVQGSDQLRVSLTNGSLEGLDPISVAMAMEYRAVANAYLLSHFGSESDEISLSVVADVNDMLIADKVQNRKDFELYHKDTHPRAAHLDQYFKNWLKVLSVSEDRYQEFVKVMEKI
jgi:hypothetical protein